jgi:hypothetical protein
VAALLPSNWNIRLIDRNAEEVSEDDLSWADLVMTGGMVVQQHDTRAIIAMCREYGIPVIVGGPDVTSSPHLYMERVCALSHSGLACVLARIAWSVLARGRAFEASKLQAA